jgi:hypothetical protein
MKRVLVFIALAVIGLLLVAAPQARAEIWTEIKGNAVDYAPYICSPCCKVTNMHAARAITVELFMPLGTRIWRLAPFETVILKTPRGACIKAGLGMEANFAD